MQFTFCNVFLYVIFNSITLNAFKSEPLDLTPYLERGDIHGAQKAAEVKPLVGDIVSYSGFFTVNEQHNSNLFFWFFPAEIDNSTAPIILWLQGGPGSSTMLGLFTSHGPYFIEKNLQVKIRDTRWSKRINMIYIDNPVGTGFSFTNMFGYSKNEKEIGEYLYIAMVQFFKLFPQYSKNDFYIVGQSYGGKFAPSLAYTIDNNNIKLLPNSTKRINLKGIAIGNGFCDPVNMLNYSDYLYEIGLIDMRTKLKFQEKQDKLIAAINGGHVLKSALYAEELLKLFHSSTDFKYEENYLFNNKPSKYGSLKTFFKNTTIRENIHVGNIEYKQVSTLVKTYLAADYIKSVKPLIEILIDKYKLLMYNGQLDILVPYPFTEKMIISLKWSGAEDYKSAERKPWYVGDNLAGYTKTVKNLTEVLVRNAGHIVPSDQPFWAYHLMLMFTNLI